MQRVNQDLITDQTKYVELVSDINVAVKCPYEFPALNLEWFVVSNASADGRRHADVLIRDLPS